jgi:hypothetical protein
MQGKIIFAYVECDICSVVDLPLQKPETLGEN